MEINSPHEYATIVALGGSHEVLLEDYKEHNIGRYYY
jgi:hypothetical protein